MLTDIMAQAKITAAVETASAALAKYDNRDGLRAGNDSGTWDMVQAARLAENVRMLLEVVADLTA